MQQRTTPMPSKQLLNPKTLLKKLHLVRHRKDLSPTDLAEIFSGKCFIFLLPHELILTILSKVDSTTRWNFLQTCSRYHDIRDLVYSKHPVMVIIPHDLHKLARLCEPLKSSESDGTSTTVKYPKIHSTWRSLYGHFDTYGVEQISHEDYEILNVDLSKSVSSTINPWMSRPLGCIVYDGRPLSGNNANVPGLEVVRKKDVVYSTLGGKSETFFDGCPIILTTKVFEPDAQPDMFTPPIFPVLGSKHYQPKDIRLFINTKDLGSAEHQASTMKYIHGMMEVYNHCSFRIDAYPSQLSGLLKIPACRHRVEQSAFERVIYVRLHPEPGIHPEEGTNQRTIRSPWAIRKYITPKRYAAVKEQEQRELEDLKRRVSAICQLRMDQYPAYYRKVIIANVHAGFRCRRTINSIHEEFRSQIRQVLRQEGRHFRCDYIKEGIHFANLPAWNSSTSTAWRDELPDYTDFTCQA